MLDEVILEKVVPFYEAKLATRGPTAHGVDWPSPEVQEQRFSQLCHVLPPRDVRFSLLDYGCGYGALLPYLREHGWSPEYTGYDPSDAMIDAARALHTETGAVFVDVLPAPESRFDFVVASGVFNIKLDVDEASWRRMMLRTLDLFHSFSTAGFAFNALSTRREAHRKKPHLFYADPAELLRLSLERYSPEVAVLHDYRLWDFTLVVRK